MINDSLSEIAFQESLKYDSSNTDARNQLEKIKIRKKSPQKSKIEEEIEAEANRISEQKKEKKL